MDDRRRVLKIISSIIIAIVGLVFLLGIMANASRSEDDAESVRTLYVKYGDQELEDGAYIEFGVLSEQRFNIEYRMSWLTGSRGYHVKIVPRVTAETNFNFDFDWYQKAYSDVSALTLAFNVTPQEKFFTMSAPGDMQEILSAQYPANTISGTPSVVNTGLHYFTLIVYSDDRSEMIHIHFGLTGPIVDPEMKLILDKVGINSILFQQFLMGAFFGYMTSFKHKNTISINHGCKTMGNHDGGLVVAELFQ